MGAPVPCLGYPSRTAAIVALRQKGLTTAEISRETGISAKNILALEESAVRITRGAKPIGKAISNAMLLPPWLVTALEAHARRRRMTPGMLAFRIIETVVGDKMIDAVMDDADGREHNDMPGGRGTV